MLARLRAFAAVLVGRPTPTPISPEVVEHFPEFADDYIASPVGRVCVVALSISEKETSR